MVHKDLGYKIVDVGRGKQANKPINLHRKETFINIFSSFYSLRRVYFPFDHLEFRLRNESL